MAIAEKIIPSIAADTIITDPVWPNALPELKGSDNPYGLLQTAVNLANDNVNRIAIQMGCNSDPRFLTAVSNRFDFFRVAWMRYSYPRKRGRLLFTSDVAYLFGKPPQSQKGKHLIPGEINHVTNSEPTPNHPCSRAITHASWLVNWWSGDDDLVLDPFCGSGTTIVACEYHGKKWCGVEIE